MGFKRHSRWQIWNRMDYEPEAVARCRQGLLTAGSPRKIIFKNSSSRLHPMHIQSHAEAGMMTTIEVKE